MKKIKGVIDRFEGEKAVIRYNGSEIILDKFLPNNQKEGDIVVITISNEKLDMENSNLVAKELLNEVLKGE